MVLGDIEPIDTSGLRVDRYGVPTLVEPIPVVERDVQLELKLDNAPKPIVVSTELTMALPHPKRSRSSPGAIEAKFVSAGWRRVKALHTRYAKQSGDEVAWLDAIGFQVLNEDHGVAVAMSWSGSPLAFDHGQVMKLALDSNRIVARRSIKNPTAAIALIEDPWPEEEVKLMERPPGPSLEPDPSLTGRQAALNLWAGLGGFSVIGTKVDGVYHVPREMNDREFRDHLDMWHNGARISRTEHDSVHAGGLAATGPHLHSLAVFGET